MAQFNEFYVFVYKNFTITLKADPLWLDIAKIIDFDKPGITPLIDFLTQTYPRKAQINPRLMELTNDLFKTIIVHQTLNKPNQSGLVALHLFESWALCGTRELSDSDAQEVFEAIKNKFYISRVEQSFFLDILHKSEEL